MTIWTYVNLKWELIIGFCGLKFSFGHCWLLSRNASQSHALHRSHPLIDRIIHFFFLRHIHVTNKITRSKFQTFSFHCQTAPHHRLSSKVSNWSKYFCFEFFCFSSCCFFFDLRKLAGALCTAQVIKSIERVSVKMKNTSDELTQHIGPLLMILRLIGWLALRPKRNPMSD